MFVGCVENFAGCLGCVVGFAIDVLVVEPYCDLISAERCDALVDANTGEYVSRAEVSLCGFIGVGSSVIDFMSSEISEHADGAACTFVVIFDG